MKLESEWHALRYFPCMDDMFNYHLWCPGCQSHCVAAWLGTEKATNSCHNHERLKPNIHPLLDITYLVLHPGTPIRVTSEATTLRVAKGLMYVSTNFGQSQSNRVYNCHASNGGRIAQ